MAELAPLHVLFSDSRSFRFLLLGMGCGLASAFFVRSIEGKNESLKLRNGEFLFVRTFITEDSRC